MTVETHEATGKRRPGRPHRITAERLEAILEAIKRGLAFDDAARAAGASAEAWRLFRRRYPEAQLAAEAARREGLDAHYRAIRARIEAAPGRRLWR